MILNISYTWTFSNKKWVLVRFEQKTPENNKKVHDVEKGKAKLEMSKK